MKTEIINRLRLIFPSFLVLVLVLSCGRTKKDFLSGFPKRAGFQMETESYNNAASPLPDFLPHLHPFAQSEVNGYVVLFGYIPFAEEYIEGVAYTTDESGKIMDSIVVSMIEPPQRQWSEIGSDRITSFTHNGIIEESGIPGELTEWTDTIHYEIRKGKFIQIE